MLARMNAVVLSEKCWSMRNMPEFSLTTCSGVANKIVQHCGVHGHVTEGRYGVSPGWIGVENWNEGRGVVATWSRNAALGT